MVLDKLFVMEMFISKGKSRIRMKEQRESEFFWHYYLYNWDLNVVTTLPWLG